VSSVHDEMHHWSPTQHLNIQFWSAVEEGKNKTVEFGGSNYRKSLWMLAQSLLRALSNIKGIPGQRGGTVGLPVGGASAPDQHAQQRVT
jgi:hypothetical protein